MIKYFCLDLKIQIGVKIFIYLHVLSDLRQSNIFYTKILFCSIHYFLNKNKKIIIIMDKKTKV